MSIKDLFDKYRIRNTAMGRRGFLRGAGGVTLALPFLPSLVSNRAQAADGVGRFFVAIRQANGIARDARGRNGATEPDLFYPNALGRFSSGDLSGRDGGRAISELAGYADQMLVLRGTRYVSSNGSCGHAEGGAKCMTGAKTTGDGKDSLALGESVDNFIHRNLVNGGEPFTLMSGSKDAYIPEVLSYSGARTRRAAQNNPYDVYQRLMGTLRIDTAPVDPEVPVDPDEPIVRIDDLRVKSANDLVAEELTALLSRRDISRDDRLKVEAHLQLIRDIELRMMGMMNPSNPSNPGPAPSMAMCSEYDAAGLQAFADGNSHTRNENRKVVTDLLCDLMALSIACGDTVAGTIQVGTGNDGTEWEDMPNAHMVSHRIMGHGSDGPVIAGAQQMHSRIDRLHLRFVRRLCDNLSSYSGPSGTLLDEGMVWFTSDLGSGVTHDSNDLTNIIIGSANGYLKSNEYIDAGNVMNNKLLNTFINAMGIRKDNGSMVDDFGDGSADKGVIQELIA